jgi:hypothetical protein
MKQPGLYGRHRDKNGRIAKKHGNALISSIRLTYPGFAPDERGSSRLVDVLDRLDEPSLTRLLKDTKDE